MGLEHAVDDPKMAEFLLKSLIPSMNPAQKVKVDQTVTSLPAEKSIPWHLASSDELEIAAMYEKIVARLRGLVG